MFSFIKEDSAIEMLEKRRILNGILSKQNAAFKDFLNLSMQYRKAKRQFHFIKMFKLANEKQAKLSTYLTLGDAARKLV